jgi:DNA-binding SARP family transcriptional activator
MQFGVLGPLEVREAGRELPLTGVKQRALLAILLLHVNEVVSSERLIDELWSEGMPGSGATALQVRVSQLRKTLGAGGQLIVTQSPGYVLRLEHEQLDLQRFERLVAEAAASEPADASSMLREALLLWRGPALAEFAFDGFAQAAIGRLEELRLTALESRIEADLVLGRHNELAAELEGLVLEHPLRERLRAQLMLALYRSGRQAEALEVYRTVRETLVDELGIEPSTALQELERRILRQDPSLELTQSIALSRSVLVVPLDEPNLDRLIELAELLVRYPPRELILARLIAAGDLTRSAALLHARRDALLANGHAARAAVFASMEPGGDLIRLASEQDVDLLLLDARPALLEDEVTRTVLRGAACDVAVFVARDSPSTTGPVLVPFAGAEHDWSAVEFGAWMARNQDVPLRLAGPEEHGRDASRLLARASLAIQRALGVAAEPVLVEPGPDGLIEAAEDAALVVLGLSDRWRTEGLGSVRSALATRARPPVVLLRRGPRPGGLAPPESYTRFTWSVDV